MLTDTAIKKAKPSDKPFRMFDGGGLYLEVAISGGKLWRFKYRFNGKEKRQALGTYPATSLAKARERRDEARRLLADGVDPSENRKVQAAAKVALAENSFEVVGREWFAKMKPEWADSHADKIMARLERDVFPWLPARSMCRQRQGTSSTLQSDR